MKEEPAEAVEATHEVYGTAADPNGELKTGLLDNLDHLVSNWFLPIGGFLITLTVGWFLSSEKARSELLDENTPGWFHFGVWRFFIRFVAPFAVGTIILFVLLGRDFS